MKNYFEELNSVNVTDKIEQKNNLNYLSWAWAWCELKKRYPKSFYTVYENEHGWFYFTDGKTAWVKTGVTVVYMNENGEYNQTEHIEYLPVMDYKNKSILLENITSFDVNKTIQRSLTKAVARHGLGLYVYAGEDLPEDDKEKPKKAKISGLLAEQLRDKIKLENIDTIKVVNVLSEYGYKALTDIEECNYEEIYQKIF